MSNTPTVSVVVLNRDRVAHVGRTIKALRHQSYRNFELIVVTNQPDILVDNFADLSDACVVDFKHPNISAARNAGITAAAGEFVAFCDDDAVPEPRWLERLIAAFSHEKIAAVGGIVRGRNGVSVQWGPQEVDGFGNEWPLNPDPSGHFVPTTSDRVIKTVGTNCAFRKAALIEIGGFDIAYRYFLDETDVNRRLDLAGWKMAIAADAEVHHGYAQSDYRSSERVPKSLLEIGASKSYFCTRFGDPSCVPEELDGFRRNQRARLIRSMELGLLAPGCVKPLMVSLEEGFVAGARRTRRISTIKPDDRSFKLYNTTAAEPETLITTRLLGRRKAHRRARELAETKKPVTVIDLSTTGLMMTVQFRDVGYWWHKGGVFGRAERNSSLFRIRTFQRRIDSEIARISAQRAFTAWEKF